MKYSLIVLCIISSSFSLFSQEYDLSGMQGLINKEEEVFLEIAGYNIFLCMEKGKTDNHRSIRDIKKEYHLNNIIAEYSNEKISVPNYIIETENTLFNGRISNQVCVLLQQGSNEMALLHFETMNQRDNVLEQQVIEKYLQNKLVPYISNNWWTLSITIAGKTIELGSPYKQEGPHHLTGKNSMIQWSEFPTMMEADLDINNRIDMSLTDNMQILAEEDVKIVFDEIPTLAYRIVYRDFSPDTPSEPLIVYYIADRIRDKYISCILSYYGESTNDYKLPPLLQKLITIPELPASAFVPIEEPEDEDYYEYIKLQKSSVNMFEIHAGTWIPLGKLSRIFNIAPSIGVYVGYPFNNRMKVDIGMQFAIPINPSTFLYHDHNTPLETKPAVMLGLNARYVYQYEIKENTFLSTYAGLGINGLTTDLEKDYYDEYEDGFFSCETLDLFGGMNIRYKLIGVFMEYHYLPYSMSGKVKSNFGNSAINLGLMFSF